MAPDPDQIPYVSQIKRLADVEDIKHVPVLGNLYGTANAVIDYAESGCHPDWHVYIETLFPAVGQVVIAILAFGIDDVLRGYFRPAGGRGFGGLGRASRRGRAPTKAQRARGVVRGGIPEVGELLGRNLPGATLVKGRNVSKGERWIWKIDAIGQRALWYWLVADITEDFVVNWTSALMRSEQCECPGSSGVNRQGGGALTQANGEWGGIPCGAILDEWGQVTSSSSFLVVPPGQSGGVTFDAKAGMVPGEDGTLNLRVIDTDTGVVANTSANNLSQSELGDGGVASHAQVGPGRWRWQAASTGGLVTVVEPRVSAWLAGCQ